MVCNVNFIIRMIKKKLVCNFRGDEKRVQIQTNTDCVNLNENF